MKLLKYVCGAFSAILTQYQSNPSSSTLTLVAPCASRRMRRSAQSFSSSVRKRAVAGVSGMKKKQMIPKITVTAPSTISVLAQSLVERESKDAVLKKIQGHLRYSPTSILLSPLAKSPPKAPLSGAAQ